MHSREIKMLRLGHSVGVETGGNLNDNEKYDLMISNMIPDRSTPAIFNILVKPIVKAVDG